MWTCSVIYSLFLGFSTVLYSAYGDSEFMVDVTSATSITVKMIDSPDESGAMFLIFEAHCDDVWRGLLIGGTTVTSSRPGPLYRSNEVFDSYGVSEDELFLVEWKQLVNQNCGYDVKLKEKDMLYFKRSDSEDAFYSVVNDEFVPLHRVS
ncbi:hypothetical protein FOZ62_008646 [Perkinsus olseni]|uniref:DOMON domain-containing protein n=1 Tax=Perkinsus olseni TaxID=32597 RepID=A0A7J6SI15_PEROL|nr:hypothetical protein FOZ62_008646 [Perkinsus olseni]